MSEIGTRSRAIALLVVLALSAWAPRGAGAQEIVRITIRPATAELAIDETLLLVADATFSDGTVANVTELVDWTSDNTGVASVSNARGSRGRVRAKGAGQTSIAVRDPISRVTSGQSGGNSVVTVLGRLTTLTVTPDDRRIPLDESRTFRATGTYSNNLERDLSEQVTWASSDPSIASVSNEPGRRGRVTAHRPGVIQLSVTSTTGVTSTTSDGDARVRVPAILVGIAIDPLTTRIPVGFRAALEAIGSFNDGSTDEITNDVIWSSSDPAVAVVSNDPGREGELVAVAEGTTVIRVVEPGTGISSTGTGGDAVVTIAGTLVSISISPTEDEVPTGLTRRFSAAGVLDDGTEFNLSRRDLRWISSDPGIAHIGNDGSDAGVLTGVSKGTVTITADHPGSGIRADEEATITILGRMIGVVIRPPSRELFVGQEGRFNAMALLDDGEEFRLSSDVRFESSNEAVAVIGNGSGQRGRATARNAGRARISVTHTPSGLASGSFDGDGEVIVRGRIEQLRIVPEKAFYVLGTEPRLRARATFDDGGFENLRSDVVWSTSDPSIAEVGNESPKIGVLQSKRVGRIFVSALEPFSGVSTTQTEGGDGEVIIVDGLQALRVRDGNPEMRTGEVFRLRAIGTYPNPEPAPGEPALVEVDLSDFVEWVSSNPAAIRIEGDRAVAVGLGEATVSARDPASGLASSQFEDGDQRFVVTAALQNIVIRPRRVRMRVGGGRRRAFRAIGRYTDGSRVEITSTVEFTTAEPNVAQVSNERDLHGLVVPFAQGRTTVMALEPITGVGSMKARRIVIRKAKKSRR